MGKYIPKSALLVEIERWIELLTNEKNQEGISLIDKVSLGGRIAELQEVITLINTIEVKEVNSTDTFIEKSCEFIRKGGNRGDAYIVTEFGEEVFDFVQLAEDFRKYIEGE